MTCHTVPVLSPLENRLVAKVGLFVVLILLLFVTGCTPVSPDRDGVTHLTLWQGINPPPNRDVFQKLVDKFNRQHPDIQVESLYVGQADQQLPKILTATIGDAAPDLLWFGSMLTGQLVDLDAIVPLDKFWNQSSISRDIDPALRESMAYEHHLWSVPFGTNNVGIFYRPSLFKAAGVEHLPTNWAELRSTAKQLTRDTNGDGKIDRYGILLPLGKGEWTVFTWLPFMWGGGGELQGNSKKIVLSNNIVSGSVTIGDFPKERLRQRIVAGSIEVPSTTSTTQIDNPGSIAALELWHNLIADGSAILSSPERGYELDNFIVGKVAMQLTGPWTLGQLAGTDVDYAVMPIPSGIRSATIIGGENLFMMKGHPKHQQAAWQFMEYVLSQEFQTEWALGTGYLPVNLKSRQQLAYQKYVDKTPAIRVFLEQAKWGRSRPIVPGYSQISDNLGRAIESVLLDRDNVRSALKTAQSRLNLSLSQ
jgi:multiple sugar transport system substrate-binding protein